MLNASTECIHQNASTRIKVLWGHESNISKGESQSCTTQNSFMFVRTCSELTPEAKQVLVENTFSTLSEYTFKRVYVGSRRSTFACKYPLIYSLAIHVHLIQNRRDEKTLLRETGTYFSSRFAAKMQL